MTSPDSTKLTLVCAFCGKVHIVSYFHYMAKDLKSTFRCDECSRIIMSAYDN